MKKNVKDIVTILSGVAVIVAVGSVILDIRVKGLVSDEYEDISDKVVDEVSENFERTVSREIGNLDSKFNARFDRIEAFYAERFQFNQEQINRNTDEIRKLSE